MNWLRHRIGKSPKPALILGKAVFLVGSILILAAAFGRAGMLNANAERAESKLPPVTLLAEVYPQYPTWLVPEGPIGFGVAALLVLVGTVLVTIASDVLKREREKRAQRW